MPSYEHRGNKMIPGCNVSEEIRLEVEEYCDEQHCTMADFVRMCIEVQLDAYRKIREAQEVVDRRRQAAEEL